MITAENVVTSILILKLGHTTFRCTIQGLSIMEST